MTEVTNNFYNIVKEQFNLVKALSKEIGSNVCSDYIKYIGGSIQRVEFNLSGYFITITSNECIKEKMSNVLDIELEEYYDVAIYENNSLLGNVILFNATVEPNKTTVQKCALDVDCQIIPIFRKCKECIYVALSEFKSFTFDDDKKLEEVAQKLNQVKEI